MKGDDKIYGKQIHERIKSLIDSRIIWTIPTQVNEKIILSQLQKTVKTNFDLLKTAFQKLDKKKEGFVHIDDMKPIFMFVELEASPMAIS
jgi:Ca2+-binding EF-hand superfamily protein